ncbi:MAG TPA: CoA ester lyase [Steroidobacteraceae bacterium]|nr:CoA ester lyase [Steroidobacteraceae bacterium]
MSAERARAPLRSLLFVPGDSERKQARALASAADALILDLEDAVDPAQLNAARAHIGRLLGSRPAGQPPELWVRVNTPASGLMREDLESVCTFRMPDGIVLPKISAAEEITEVAAQLERLESHLAAAPGSTRIVVIATETPKGLLVLPRYPAVLEAAPALRARLAGLTWGAEDLSTAIGALGKRDATGAFTFTFQLARSACLLAAAALGVQPIDGVHTDLRDAPGLERELGEARRDGFTGKLAIHPDQVGAINAAFTPTDAEREHARRVVAAFAARPGAGVASLDGQMIDRPHLIQAQRILAAAPPDKAKT